MIERLADNRVLSGALAAITAAVVGVIANLALWFGLRVLFGELANYRVGPMALDLPVPASLDPLALLIALLAVLALFRLKLGVIRTLGLSAGAGLALRLVFGA